MSTRLLLGDEALAQGAIDAGLSGAYGYPGTPSTEITEYVQRSPEARSGAIRSRWTANEKTAVEAALGMCYAGKRAMASMKHVGLNVAADPFINAAISGTNGGLLINVADDPSMHSSQNEQDSRLYTEIALVPCIEPANQQEAYEVPAYALDFSERHRIPVLVRLTTRLAHSRAPVTLGAKRPQNVLSAPTDRERFILLPSNARRSYDRLILQQRDFLRESEESPFNRLIEGPDTSLGVIACGIAYNYVLEVTDGAPRFPVLKVGQYPLPLAAVERLLARCSEILVLEEGYPYVESLPSFGAASRATSLAPASSRHTAWPWPSDSRKCTASRHRLRQSLGHRLSVQGARTLTPVASSTTCWRRGAPAASSPTSGATPSARSHPTASSTPASTWARRSRWPRAPRMPACAPLSL
jgi:indolepyruvate ferredoxin oxidoreductase alpha subunit